MEKTKLGELIRQRRRELRLTQRELGANLGISDGYIANIEIGRQRGSYEVLAKLSMALGIKWQDVLDILGTRVPDLYSQDSVYPIFDKVFTEFHPKIKEILIGLGQVLKEHLKLG